MSLYFWSNYTFFQESDEIPPPEAKVPTQERKFGHLLIVTVSILVDVHYRRDGCVMKKRLID
jgi:hypothetical protein